MRAAIHRLLRWLLLPADASGCACHQRGKDRPGFRASDWY